MSTTSKKHEYRQQLEDYVANALDKIGYIFVIPARFYPALELEQPIYTRQYEIGKDIYGKKRKVDIILYHPRLYPNNLAIQCKWQFSRGSVEEKYPFEVQSIAQNRVDTIIILDGEGYSPGAKQWLINQAGRKFLIHVFDKKEFLNFVDNGRL